MPHRPRPRGYEAFDIWLGTQDSAGEALGRKDWTPGQQVHIGSFTDYATINKIEFVRNGKTQTRYRNKQTGKFVRSV